ncbi:MAG: hypothetical protein M3446_04395 [Actinomycetota bacterium]|nr:hypothetical protein [Actinomycetota bacterium]
MVNAIDSARSPAAGNGGAVHRLPSQFGKDDVSGWALRRAAQDRERRQTKGVAQDVEHLLGVFGGRGYPNVLQGRRPSR